MTMWYDVPSASAHRSPKQQGNQAQCVIHISSSQEISLWPGREVPTAWLSCRSYKSHLLSSACSFSLPHPSTQYNIQLNHTFPISSLSSACNHSTLPPARKSPFLFLYNTSTFSTQKHFKMVVSPVLRMVAQRRALSVFSRVRALARTVEPHPFERLPITQKAAKADWGKQIKHVGDAAML